MAKDTNNVVVVGKTLWNVTSQASHVAVSFAIMQIVKHHGSHSLIIMLIGLLLAVIKEFWYDYHYETETERGSSLLDFVMYALGLGLGYIL